MTVLFRALRRIIARRAPVSAIVLASAFALVRLTAMAQGLHQGLFQQMGQTYYVSPYGDDSNPGTESQPWRTPTKAGNTAQAGDTVYFRGGIYSGQLVPQNSGNPTVGWIVFRNYPNEDPIIVHDAPYSKAIYVSRVNYIEINGLTGEAAGTNGPGIGINNAHHIRIINSVARNSGTSGIATTNGVDHILIEGNVVFGNSNRGQYNGSGMSICNSGCLFSSMAGDTCEPMNDGAPGYHIVIRGNLIYDNRNIASLTGRPETDGNGIIMDNNGPNNPPTLIDNNIIVHNGGRCIHNFNSAHTDILNNTCYHNQETPRLSSSGEIVLARTSTSTFDITIRNNAVYSNDGGRAISIYGDPMIMPNEYSTDYNLWHNGAISIGGGGTIGPHASTGQDPQFFNPTLDPLTADFHLRPTSPAIDSGTDEFASVTTHDFDDNARPQGTGYDIGAYEYQGGEPPVPTYPRDYRVFIPIVWK